MVNSCLEVLTVHGNDLHPFFSLRHSPYCNYLCQAPDIAAKATIHNILSYDTVMGSDSNPQSWVSNGLYGVLCRRWDPVGPILQGKSSLSFLVHFLYFFASQGCQVVSVLNYVNLWISYTFFQLFLKKLSSLLLGCRS